MNIQLLIAETISELMSEHKIKTVPEINDGYCFDFAMTLKNKLGGAGRIITSWQGHYFLKYRDRYFDAEVPNGVREVFQLPYYRRNPNHLQRRCRRPRRILCKKN